MNLNEPATINQIQVGKNWNDLNRVKLGLGVGQK